MSGSPPSHVDLLVVGAGITGLSAAWRAHQEGRSVLLLEGSPRVGGVIRTDRVGGYRVERAAAAFPASAEHVLSLHASVPGAPAIHEPSAAEAEAGRRRCLLTSRGVLAFPESGPGFALTPLLPIRAKVRFLSEALRGPRRGGAPETAYAFVRRRFGIAVAERFLKPFTLGVYGSHPDEIGWADAFPALATVERESGGVIRSMFERKRGGDRGAMRTFEGGMESFPRAIAAALCDRVATGVAATGLGAEGGGVVVSCSDGVERRAGEVLLSTTADHQARLVDALSPAAAGILGTVRYVPMTVVALGVPPGGSPPVPRAFGFLRAPGARARILGASFPSVLDAATAPEGHSVMSVFLGGSGDPDAMALSDDEVRWIVERDLSRALGGRVRPDMFDVCRHARAIPLSSLGHRERMATAARLLAPHRVRLWGSHVSGVGIPACCAPPPTTSHPAFSNR